MAIYARYSTDKQKPVSIAVQNENTRAFLTKQGWTEVDAYADEAITGAVIKLRPGMTALLRSGERGEVDMVLADELDRLSRSQSQTPMIFERLQFLGVSLHTIAEGKITRLQVGIKGTMNAEQLAATSRKTRDAIAKRFRDGQNPGGFAYGYALDFVPDARGDRIPGHRRIVPEQAETVIYICQQYAAGRSGQDIAIELNARGTAGAARRAVECFDDQRQQGARHRHPQQPALHRRARASATDLAQGPRDGCPPSLRQPG